MGEEGPQNCPMGGLKRVEDPKTALWGERDPKTVLRGERDPKNALWG